MCEYRQVTQELYHWPSNQVKHLLPHAIPSLEKALCMLDHLIPNYPCDQLKLNLRTTDAV